MLQLATHQATVSTAENWRAWARFFIALQVRPADIDWQEGDGLPPSPGPSLAVNKEFPPLAARLACHRDPERWALLYETLWRMTHGEKNLLKLLSDPLVARLHEMVKAINRDVHKTKAFVRFRETSLEGQEWFIAWHRPDHRILRLAAPFFQNRFGNMRFAILTPDESVWWDLESLRFGPGVAREDAPQGDVLEDLWKQYYRSTFNPARIKLKMMKSEMAVRHWSTLPETQMIPQMLAEAPERVAKMLKHTEGSARSAADFMPAKTDSLEALREAAKGCEGCPLYGPATQTVFGEGNPQARLVLVGEQPGDKEDLAGHPFVGPAGQMLEKALKEAGLERDDLYITNAVKHFKFTLKEVRPGKDIRWHQNPTANEIRACKPWLEQELTLIAPKAVLCLGVSAAKSVISHGFVLARQRQQWFELPNRPPAAATYHPASILRLPDAESRTARFEDLVQDLRFAAQKAAW